MERRPWLMSLVLLVAFTLSAGINAASYKTVDLGPISLDPGQKNPGAACTLIEHNGTPATIATGIAVGMGWAQYFDPADCGTYPFYPFEIQDVSFSLFNDGGIAQWPVTLDIVVYSAVVEGDACTGIGEELCRVTFSATQGSFEYPTVGSVTVDCCVYGPVFVVIQYSDFGPGPFPSLLFDDNPAPDTCEQWYYDMFGTGIWEEFYDLYAPSLPGQLVVEVTGETESAACDTNAPDGWYTISELYDAIDYIDGAEVRVIGEFVSDDVSILVENYYDYLRDEIMPIHTDLVIAGLLPDPSYWYGGEVVATGVVSVAADPYPAYETDTLEITLTVTSYDLRDPSDGLPTLPSLPPPPIDGTIEFDGLDGSNSDCDSCKFAILVSSGGAARWGRPDYWVNLNTLYRHKIDNEDYCPNNVFVHFDGGDAEDSTQIPNASVHPATESAIDDTHDEISRRIAACHRAGKKSTVQKLFTNHGSDNNGVVLTGAGDGRYLSPEEATEMQQKLIDSCCAFLFDEFITCYGGDMLNGLKDLDNLNKTEIHANSAAPDDAAGWSPYRTIDSAGDTTYIPHHYLAGKVGALAEGKDYEEAVRIGEERYLDFLENRVIPGQVRDSTRQEAIKAHWQSERNRGDSLWNAGALTWAQYQNWINTCNNGLNNAMNRLARAIARLAKLRKQVFGTGDTDGTGQGSPSWVRKTFQEYCEWEKFYAPPGGELKFEFSGSGSGGNCGNITVWEKQANGSYARVRQWNWNLPGADLFTPGNNERVLHVPPTGTGEYYVHNDNGQHTITVDAYTGRPDASESPSNDTLSFGWSLGWNDDNWFEFFPIQAPFLTTPGVNQDFFNLQQVPAFMSAFEGVPLWCVQFESFGPPEYWQQMELTLDILNVHQPGQLGIECLLAENQFQQIIVDTPGVYVVPLGFIQPDPQVQLCFDTFGQSIFDWDCLGLRSAIKLTLQNDCLIVGDINHDGQGPDIADLVYLVAYMFSGGPPPVVLAEADINGDGSGPDIADLVYLVAYMFQGGPAPVPCGGGSGK